MHKLALMLRAQRPQTGVAPSHLCYIKNRFFTGGGGVAHSLLATSTTSDRVNHEIRRRKVTYRHGAQVKDVPVMIWSTLRYDVYREEVCAKGGCCEHPAGTIVP